MYKALKVEVKISKKMLIVMNSDNKMKQSVNVRIIRTVLHFHRVVVDSNRVE